MSVLSDDDVERFVKAYNKGKFHLAHCDKEVCGAVIRLWMVEIGEPMLHLLQEDGRFDHILADVYESTS
jgi:hypothetical protein